MNPMNPDESQPQTPAELRSEKNFKALFIAWLTAMCFCYPPFIFFVAIGCILRLYGFLPSKRHTAPQPDLHGEAGQAFNLATLPAGDGWRDAGEANQSAEDRQAADARQGDMFPDSEGFAPGAHGPGF